MPSQHSPTRLANSSAALTGGLPAAAPAGAPQAASAVLDGKETSQTSGPPPTENPRAFSMEIRCDGTSPRQTLQALNRTRRIRRMRRVVISHADAVRDRCQQGGNRTDTLLVTLTYRPGVAWAAKDVSGYTDRLRKWLARQGIQARYQWVMELQKRGVPHYHLLLWVPKGVRIPKPDESRMWPHGFTNIKLATRPVGYLVKYATKGGDIEKFPPGARLFGVASPDEDHRLLAHRKGLPAWLEQATPSDSRCSRVTRVGWVDRNTGEVHHSPYVLKWIKDDWGIPTIHIVSREILNA